MPADVQAISGTLALVAARLCNFSTGKSQLLPAHEAWIKAQLATVGPALTWIDLIGYASHLGDADSNQRLSSTRCEAVKASIKTHKPASVFNVDWGKGESESGGTDTDNSGYWRAVDVYMFGFPPPHPVPKAPTEPGSKTWKIRVVSGFSGGVTIPWTGMGPQYDDFLFEIVNMEGRTHALFGYDGRGFNLPCPKLPNIAFARKGKFKPFATSRPESVASFEGNAYLTQDAGVNTPVPGGSLGGTVRLRLKGRTLIQRQTLVHPNPIPLQTGPGISISTGSGTEGYLRRLTDETYYRGL